MIAKSEEKRLVVSDGVHEVVFALNDTPAARGLAERLPLHLAVENYADNEKICYLPAPLPKGGNCEADCPAGALAWFSPWNNLVFYYGPAPRYPGLYLLGQAEEGATDISRLTGMLDLREG